MGREGGSPFPFTQCLRLQQLPGALMLRPSGWPEAGVLKQQRGNWKTGRGTLAVHSWEAGQMPGPGSAPTCWEQAQCTSQGVWLSLSGCHGDARSYPPPPGSLGRRQRLWPRGEARTLKPETKESQVLDIGSRGRSSWPGVGGLPVGRERGTASPVSRLREMEEKMPTLSAPCFFLN